MSDLQPPSRFRRLASRFAPAQPAPSPSIQRHGCYDRLQRFQPPQAGRTVKTQATAEGNFRAKPQFRSALEQVSYVTNNKLWDESKQQKGKGLGIGFLGL
ncbi:hypothetical protein WJX73_002976 [Symbiochloris irregularis]|uniref:Uncharacterized protein n=1 Tax=Symbiochloris irregularis TaxID=706552 RepID=A0AAW1PBK7_9CHLO